MRSAGRRGGLVRGLVGALALVAAPAVSTGQNLQADSIDPLWIRACLSLVPGQEGAPPITSRVDVTYVGGGYGYGGYFIIGTFSGIPNRGVTAIDEVVTGGAVVKDGKVDMTLLGSGEASHTEADTPKFLTTTHTHLVLDAATLDGRFHMVQTVYDATPPTTILLSGEAIPAPCE